MAIVAGGHGSPRYGCRQSWRNGLTACANRLTIRSNVADPVLLSGLQDRLTESATVAYLTEAVSAKVAATLDARPQRRQQLELERTTTGAPAQEPCDNARRRRPVAEGASGAP
jgi:hypothetical protein